MSKATPEQAVADWNLESPIGTHVIISRDDHRAEITRTRSEAWVLGGVAVVKVHGIAGGYDLRRLSLLSKDSRFSDLYLAASKAVGDLHALANRLNTAHLTEWAVECRMIANGLVVDGGAEPTGKYG